MTFVDTNVIMYAVGGEHPLRAEAQAFFADAMKERRPLATSAEVLQELLHAYVPVDRLETLDAALSLVDGVIGSVWSVEADDIRLAVEYASSERRLGARDLVHLACCARREVSHVMTFDRGLAGAFGG